MALAFQASPTSSLAPGISPNLLALLIHTTSSAFFHPPPPPPPPQPHCYQKWKGIAGGLSSRGFSGLKEETLRSHAYPYPKEWIFFFFKS